MSQPVSSQCLSPAAVTVTDTPTSIGTGSCQIGVEVIADLDNTERVEAGGTDLVWGNGTQLDPGDCKFFPVTQMALVKVVAASGITGQKVRVNRL